MKCGRGEEAFGAGEHIVGPTAGTLSNAELQMVLHA
jgi:hypothetical protein